MDTDRIYRHFCMMARALEVVGERWSLLIVRDLLLGPRRFTDLSRGLSEITPARLTSRLRQLEAAGIVVRESATTGREVWYRLTDAGRALEPTIDALTLWGIEYARKPPLRGETVGAEPTMIGTKVWLNRFGGEPVDAPVWAWRFPPDDQYTLRLGTAGWELARGRAEEASVTVISTPEAWARFMTAPRERRRLPLQDIRLEGLRAEVRKFAKVFSAKLVSQ
jgi:DNA-binding HxlR family transcriptional regulator